MTERVLPLRPGCLDAPTQIDLDVVAATMLWPDDEPARQQAIAASAVASIRDHLHELQRDDLIEFGLLAVDATPLKGVREKAAKRFVDGVRAGTYLRETIGQIRLGKKTKMASAAETVSASLGPSTATIDPHSFRSHIWSKYRCVAHFWAASSDLNYERIARTGASRMPCALSELRALLALAEGYRRLGICTKAVRAPDAILDLSDTVYLPPWFLECTMPQFELR